MPARWRDWWASVKGGPRQHALPFILFAGVIVLGGLALSSCGTSAAASGPVEAVQTAATEVAQVTTTSSVDSFDLPADLLSPAEVVLDRVYSSVVNIAVTVGVGLRSATGIGSGVIYTSDGYILTNDHVVTLEGNVTSGQSIVVTLSDDTKLTATIVGEDSARDIAVIKVDATGLNPVTFTKSSPMQLAEWVIVIGSPLDFRNSVSLGIVSGLNRTLDTGTGQPPLTGLMQIDAPISPGNSGGGCFDTQGRFTGMPEAYLPPGATGAERIGFAIPAEVVHSAARALVGR